MISISFARRAIRSGFTLIELMIVIVLLGLVLGTTLRVVLRQQRFYRSAGNLMDTRSQLRQAAAVLPVDLRGMSPVGGDITAIGNDSIAFRATYGSAVVCALSSPVLNVPPDSLASGNDFTSMLQTPAVNDTVYILNDSTSGWNLHTLIGVDSGTTACSATSYVSGGDAGKYRYTLRISPAPTTAITVGAPIRFTRRVKYALYQPSGSTDWYLGYETFDGSAWSGKQPIAGPLLARNTTTPAAAGLYFAYYDTTGTAVTTLANATKISRIDIILRAATAQISNISGAAPSTTIGDSLAITVALRNRS